MMLLVMFALFIERVLEVLLTSWRSHRSAELKERAATARSKSNKHEPRLPDEEAYRQYRSETRRIALCTAPETRLRSSEMCQYREVFGAHTVHNRYHRARKRMCD